MKSKELEAFIAAAHTLINQNRARPRKQIDGLAMLWVTLANYEASELHKPACLHPKASEQTDDLQEVAK